MSSEQLRDLLLSKRSELGVYFDLAYIQLVGGFRVSDVLGIQWDKIINDTDILVGQGKGSEHRRVHVPECSRLLRDCRISKRHPFSGISRFQVYRLYKRLGIVVMSKKGGNNSVTHAMRKLFVRDTNLRADSLVQVKEAIGHKSIKSTEKYV